MLVGIAFFSLASVSYLLVPPRLLILIRFLQGQGAAALSIRIFCGRSREGIRSGSHYATKLKTTSSPVIFE